ncbi:MAG: chromate transporter [Bacilli bacterium]|nr:chromate transporter [Bacilli bacterium]
MIYFELFYVFFLIGLFTFGGGYAMIPMIQTEIVGRGWITDSALTDFIAISEATPGPFAINIATFVGSHTAGIFGSVCATLGVILPSFIIILLVAFILTKVIKNRFVQGALKGVRPIILALILSTAIVFFVKMLLFSGNNLYTQAATFDRKSFTLLILVSGYVLTYKLVNKKYLNPILILLLCGLLGMILFS